MALGREDFVQNAAAQVRRTPRREPAGFPCPCEPLLAVRENTSLERCRPIVMKEP